MRSHTLIVAVLIAFTSAPADAQDQPLEFLPNQGQWDAAVRFAARHGPMVTWLTDRGLTTRAVEREVPLDPGRASAEAPIRTRGVVVDMTLLGIAPLTAIPAAQPGPGRHHFLVGNDPARWATDVPGYAAVRCPDVYPGVDLMLLQRGGRLAYDLTVAPGVDPGVITLAFEGQRQLRIDPDGSLVLVTELGELRHSPPRAFAESDGEQVPVACQFVQRNAHTVGFAVGSRPADATLVIDPAMLWSTYLSGSQVDNVEVKNGMIVAANGDLLLVGITGSLNFPYTTGLVHAGLTDAFVTRFDPNGAIVWSTFLGGSGHDKARGIAENAAGDLFVAGFTSSVNFPIRQPAYQSIFGGIGSLGYGDGFVARLTSCGCSLPWSTYLGGTDDESGRNVAVDNQNRVYVAGWTLSPRFPIAGTPYQGTRASAAEEGFIALLDPAIAGSGQLVASTYLGGAGTDWPALLALDATGNPVLAGVTRSADYPTTANAFIQVLGGLEDGFLARFDASLTTLLYSSYFGGSAIDNVNAMSFNTGGEIALAGWTDSIDLPTTPNAYQPSRVGGANDGYVAVLDTTLAPTQQLVYGTFLGGTGDEGINGMAIESSGMIAVAGSARAGFPTTRGSFQPTFQGGGGSPHGVWDGFATRIDPERPGSAALIYSTYLGGTANWDWAYEVEIAPDGGAFVAGITFSSNFPTQPPAQYRGQDDVFLTRLSMLPTGVDAFGAPTSCGGPLYAGVSSEPFRGNAAFEVWCTGAPATSFGMLLFGRPLPGGMAAPLGLTAYLDLNRPIATVATVSNGLGFGTVPIPLPAFLAPGSVGAAQWLWVSAGPPWCFAASNALDLTIQP